VNAVPRLRLVEQENGDTRIILDGHLAGAFHLGWNVGLRNSDIELVERLLARDGFDYAFDEQGERAAHRYGRTLWQAILDAVADPSLRRYLQAARALDIIVEGDAIQEPIWELINSGAPRHPRWLCLTGTVIRTYSSLPQPQSVAGVADDKVMLLTSRPYAADDIPFDLLPRAVARALSRSNRLVLKWVPDMSRSRLGQLSRRFRPWMIHIDAHAVSYAKFKQKVIDHPHILLESETGPDPCDMSGILGMLGGQPPDLLMVTSCGTDVRGVAPQQTVQGQALCLGVKGVLLSRRRLTPAEVTRFSAMFYSSLAAGSSVAGALACARAALRREARSNRQIGRMAWASFTYYRASEDVSAALDQGIEVTTTPEALIPSPPPWLLTVRRQPRYVIVQCKPDEADAELDAAAQWIALLEPPLRLSDASSSASDTSAAAVTVANLTAEFTSRIVLQSGSPILPSAATGTTLVFLQCPPETVTSQCLGAETETLTATRNWEPHDCHSRSPIIRWWRLPGSHGLAGPPRRLVARRNDAEDQEFDQVLDLLYANVTQGGHSAVRLTRFLLSYSTGYWHRRGFTPQHLTKTFLAGEAFVSAAYRAGLTRRTTIGVYELHVFHPRLIGAIHRRLMSQSYRCRVPANEPWLDWLQRLGEYPELREVSDQPSPCTTVERLTGPDRAFGGVLAAICLRNHIFRDIVGAQQGRSDSYWWTGYDEFLTTVDRRTRDAIAAGQVLVPSAFGPSRLKREVTADEINSEHAQPVRDLPIELINLLAAVPRDQEIVHGSLLSDRVHGWCESMVASVFQHEDEQIMEALGQMLAQIPWPEDRGIVLAAAGNAASGRNTELALQLYGEAFSALSSIPTPMCRAFALDTLHWKAVLLRQQDRSAECKEVIDLGTKLIKAWDFGEWHASCAEFLEEVARVDVASHLEITGDLMRWTGRWPISDQYIVIEQRIIALMRARRFADAAGVARRAIANAKLNERQRTSLLVHLADCLQRMGRNSQAANVCQQALRTAERSIRAHASLIQGMAYLGLSKAKSNEGEPESVVQAADQAIASFQIGWQADGATPWGSECGEVAVNLLNALGRYEEALRLVGDVRRSALFPWSSQVCLNGAVAAANLGDHDTMRELLSVGAWAQVSEDIVVEARRLGFIEDLEVVAEQVARNANEWIVSGNDVVRPPEIRISREDFTEYWCAQTIDRSLAWLENDAYTRGNRDQVMFIIMMQLGAVHDLAKKIVDANPQLARTVYQMICRRLDGSPAMQHSRVRIIYAAAAFWVGSINRELSDLDGSVAWGEIAVRVARSAMGDEDPSIRDAARDEVSRSLVMIGNSYFDQLRFNMAVVYHTQGLLELLGRNSGDAMAILPQVLGEILVRPTGSDDLILAMFNLGNSLMASNSEFRGIARGALLVSIANLPNLEEYLSGAEGQFVVSGLIREQEFFGANWVAGDWAPAWQQVQAAYIRATT
jgi:tetratricopeptide (TPR) repeat protein